MRPHRAPSSRTPIWWVRWVVAALLLQTAVPLFAAGAARWQGRPLVEVCSVYGVRTVALDDAGNQPVAGFAITAASPHGASDHTASHGPAEAAAHAAAHCVLSGVLALPALPGTGPSGVVVVVGLQGAPQSRPAPQPCDATARWIAQRKHGPPVAS